MDVLSERLAAVPGAPAIKRVKPLRVCLINPRFEPSFWGFDFTLPMLPGNKRYWSTPGAFPTLAALVPEGVEIELVDENVRSIDWDDLRRFDIVGITGMIVQRARMVEILTRLRDLPALVIVGGPYVTVAETALAHLCDVRFIGEADESWPAFLTSFANGEAPLERYEQAEKTDMSKVPTGRYDLLDMSRYGMATVQFSRGCPFQCEFCDIITIFGRRPRLKTTEQFLAELDAVRRTGARLCFLVDDNFIGNKVAVKKMLPHLIEWQKRNGYAMQLYTEASVNLADDAELIEMMVQANFRQVFVGLESPRAESLIETLKFQNTRGDSLLEKIGRIRDGGLVLQAGFIVGFDNDDPRIFDEQYEFIEESGVGQAMVSILTPIPTTPLYDRLKAEGRLNYTDPEVAFVPKLMTQAELRTGHADLIRRLYEAPVFFGRVFKGYRSATFRARRRALDRAAGMTGFRSTVTRNFGALLVVLRLARELTRKSAFWRLFPQYVRLYVNENLAMRGERMPFYQFVSLCLMHWHFYNIARRPHKGNVGITGDVEVSPGRAAVPSH